MVTRTQGALERRTDGNHRRDLLRVTVTASDSHFVSATMVRVRKPSTTSLTGSHLQVPLTLKLGGLFVLFCLIYQIKYYLVIDKQHKDLHLQLQANKKDAINQHLRQRSPPTKNSTKAHTILPVPRDISRNSNTYTSNEKVHIVVSTGCTAFQDWQAYLMFHSIYAAGQPGKVTRVASGCTDQQAEQDLRDAFEKQIRVMSSDYHLHITPDFSRSRPGVTFKYFNKPFGLAHWFRNGLAKEDINGTMFVILDPDMLVLRPFTNKFDHEMWLFDRQETTVGEGRMFAAKYAMGTNYLNKMNMSFILGSDTEESPLRTFDHEEARNFYMIGPPYVGMGEDLAPLCQKWADFAVAVQTLSDPKDILPDMYAYMIAARHLNRPHQTATSFMVSNTPDERGEAWTWIDAIDDSEICSSHPPMDKLPNVIHFCQRYFAGMWFFSKYQLPKDFLSCEHPLMKDPTDDLSVQRYDWAETMDGKRHELNAKTSKRMTFMLCQIIPRLNNAATYFKKTNCDGNANYEKSFNWEVQRAHNKAQMAGKKPDESSDSE